MDLKSQITGLNTLLSEIYGDGDMRLSRFLAKIGIGDDDIEAIRRGHMEELTTGCIALLEKGPFKNHGRSFRLISLRMGLEGAPPRTLQEIGDDFGISRERVRQLEKKALARLKNPKTLALLETDIRELASGLLQINTDEDNSHPYIIEADVATGAEKRLLIHKGKDTNPSLDIVLTKDTFASFHNDLMIAAKSLGWNRMVHSHSISEIKKRFPRAYERWSDEEDHTLKTSFSEGADISEQSALLGRQPGAIRSRLEKLGLMVP